LARAREEAQSLVADAAEQASLIHAGAESSSDELVTSARTEAERIVADARADADHIRAQAEGVIAAARAGSKELRDQVLADFAQVRIEHEEQLLADRAAFDARLEKEAADAAIRGKAITDESRDAARDLLEAAHAEIAQAREAAELERVKAAKQAEALLDAGRENIARELAEAAEQTAWTKQTMAGLRAAAELDAQHIRAQAQTDAESAVKRARARIADVITSSRELIAARTEQSERDRETMIAKAGEVVAAAHANAAELTQAAETVHADAKTTTERLHTETRQDIGARLERADRRVAEAESGARVIRERVAEDMARAQREVQEVRRKAKQEAAELVSTARAEADQVRTRARTQEAQYREEVERLTAQRDRIATELGNLSGVIDALAVSGPKNTAPLHPGATTGSTSDTAREPSSPQPPNETMRDT
jgi:vacuolar-type H+-ATPase subunit H